jgi:hypothetical protein
MRFALTLFLAVVLSRIIAAGFGTAHLWSFDFSPVVALVLSGPVIVSRGVTLLLLATLLVSYMLLHALLSAAIVAGNILPHDVATLVLIAMLGLRAMECSKAGAFVASKVAGCFGFCLVTKMALWLTSPAMPGLQEI